MADDADLSRRPQSHRREAEMPLQHEPQCILIVDDSEDDVYATRRAFARTNLHNPIKHARSGEMALSYLRDERNPLPGLILLDLNMPGIGGHKTLKLIKDDSRLKSIPIVVLTTSGDERDVNASYQSGANSYIQKPVDFDGLIAAIRQLKEYWFEIVLLPKMQAHD
jgi:two-component system response regulator